MRRLLSFVLFAALLLVHAPLAAQPTPSSAPAEAAGPLLYVCNQGEATVSVIDMRTHAVVDTVDLQAMGFSANAKPHHAVAEPDGSFWYLSLIGENTVLKLNRQNEIVGRASFETPGMLALHPTQQQLWVGRSMSAVNPPQSIGVIRRTDMSIHEIDTFFSRPHALTIDPLGDYAYTASLASNQVMAIDTESEITELRILGGAPQTLVQFAPSPDGKTLIAGGQVTGEVLVFDVSTGTPVVVTDTFDVGGQPWHPVFAPDGKRAYVPNKTAHSVTVLDVDGASIAAVIEGEGLAQPHGTALSLDGRYLFVSNNNQKGTYTPKGANPEVGTVVIIDTQTNEIVKVIEVGVYPTGIGTWGGQRAHPPRETQRASSAGG